MAPGQEFSKPFKKKPLIGPFTLGILEIFPRMKPNIGLKTITDKNRRGLVEFQSPTIETPVLRRNLGAIAFFHRHRARRKIPKKLSAIQMVSLAFLVPKYHGFNDCSEPLKTAQCFCYSCLFPNRRSAEEIPYLRTLKPLTVLVPDACRNNINYSERYQAPGELQPQILNFF